MKVTKLLKKEHPQSGTVIKGYGMRHFIKTWNLHVINRKLDYFLPQDTPDLRSVDKIIRKEDTGVSDVDDMTVSAFKDLSADEQKTLLLDHGVEKPGSNYKERKKQFEEITHE